MQVSPTTDASKQTDSPFADVVSSPGYCAADYQPLAQLCPPPPKSPSGTAPARKKSTLAGGTGRIMKEAYFKGIKWTETFVTGPLDSDHNKH